MIEWYVKGREYVNCNCDYGCPCQFNALPTTGNCEAAGGYLFEEGKFGDVSLDGVKAAVLFHWPGPIHEGGGTAQLIFDEASSEAQRSALAKIMRGEETEPIRNPVTGAEHRARIDLPNGFEYRIAEISSGNTRTGAEAGIRLNLQNSYGQLAHIHLGHTGRLN